MPWILLMLAGLFEVGFTTCLQLSENSLTLNGTLALSFASS